jgi:aminoglycoside phosphotransferase (APT) family kinase protein
MIEIKICKLFDKLGLGAVTEPIVSVAGGYMHRMYKVVTAEGSYAVKHLNPNLMKRPEVMENYRRAEKLEAKLEDTEIPIVPALVFNGEKMQKQRSDYFYIFRWQTAEPSENVEITAKKCKIAGKIQGMIHAIAPEHMDEPQLQVSSINWEKVIAKAKKKTPDIADLLEENVELLKDAEERLNVAWSALPWIRCIVDDDMDPKNMMWEGDKPVVIDLECLDYGNPVAGTMQLALQWAGATDCALDYEKLKAYFDGYLEAYDNGFRDYGEVYGLTYAWIDWLAYNASRANGKCADDAERELGKSEVRKTLERIKYLREMEDEVKAKFAEWFAE